MLLSIAQKQGCSMRPGQNKRMRGRNNNRKGPNPLTRSYESNGPDVKVRGTAQHVAEKYLQLARDAQSSGDPVMAESYLQHAEHYFRIIAAAMQAQQQQQAGYLRPPGEAPEPDESDDDDDGDIPDRFASPFERNQPVLNPPQPNFSHQQPPFPERPQMMDRQPHQDRGPRQDNRQENRQDRPDRQNQQRDFRDRDHRQHRDRNFNNPRPAPVMPAPVVNEPPRDEPQPPTGLPAFITGGVRPAPLEAPQPAVVPAADAPPAFEGEHENAAFHLRNRRRRRPRPAGPDDSGQGEAGNERPYPDEVPAGE